MCASLLLMLVTYSSPFEVLHFILVDSNHTIFSSGSVRVREFLTRRLTSSLLLNSAFHYVSLSLSGSSPFCAITISNIKMISGGLCFDSPT